MVNIPAVFRLRGRSSVKSIEDGVTESTFQPTSAPIPAPTPAPTSTLVTGSQVMTMGEEKLAAFRHCVGIHDPRPRTEHPDLWYNNFHIDGRVAPNLGIYNRVVHREQQAKRGYKVASILINSCLGGQLVVAATLTALGAANSSYRSVTAFGAINTIIAGMLTYLKGSGLPDRIRYYEHEWKRVREYIEQRERDFSRPDCNLDIYEVTGVIEEMYEEAKTNVRTNTPDSYVGVSDTHRNITTSTDSISKMGSMPKMGSTSKISGHDIAASVGNTAGAGGSKLKELELKYGHKVAELLEKLSKKEEERLMVLEKEIGGHGEESICEENERDMIGKASINSELEKKIEK